MKIILFLFISLGIFNFSLIILNIFFFNLSINQYKKINKFNCIFSLLISSSWFLFLGIIGSIFSALFHLNKPLTYSYYILLFFSCFGYLLSIYYRKDFIFFYKNFFLLLLNFFKLNKYLLILFFIIVSIYIYKLPIPWIDIDEIVRYGIFTKLSANGWNVNSDFIKLFSGTNLEDLFIGGMTRFAELMYTYFYVISESNIIPRFIRLISLFFNFLSLYYLCRFINISKKISFLAGLIFLTTPELAYIGLSMKVDVVLLNFELMSIILLFYSIFSIKIVTIKNIVISDNSLKILILALIFASIATSIKLSGAYVFILILLSLIFVSWSKRKNFKLLLKYFSIFSICSCLIFLCYFANYYNFGNPFYPLDGFWLKFFPNAEIMKWGGGSTQWIRENYNINLGNPIFNFFYILVYHSMGLEEPIFSNIKFLIHPNKAGSGWITPLTMIMLIAPLYAFKSKKVLFSLFSLIFLYLFWINGLQYSRVFVASSTIAIFITAIIINLKWRNNFYKYLSKFIFLLSIMVLLLSTYYHFRSAVTKNPYGIKLWFDKEIIFESNNFSANVGRGRDNINSKNKITFNEKMNIENILMLYSNKTLILNDLNYESLHVFFKKGNFVNFTKLNDNQLKKIMDFWLNENINLCLLTYLNTNKELLNKFNKKLYKSENDLIFYCLESNL